MEQVSTRLVGLLWPGRGKAKPPEIERLDKPHHTEMVASIHFGFVRLAVSAALRLWQRWHSASGRRAALTGLGIPPSRRDLAHSSRGAWRMARHAVMQEARNNRVLKRHGLITPSDLAK